MKILGIEGSPRKEGNTEKLVQQILKGAADTGCQSHFIKLATLNIEHCTGCGSCRATGECVLTDDMDTVYNAIQDSNVIVIGSPVYAWQVSGITKDFMDRLCRLLTQDYQSRLSGPKKIAFAYTQGNPDPRLFREYFDYQEKVYAFLGFTLAGRIQGAGTRAKDDILSHTDVLQQAASLGRELVAGDNAAA